MIKIEIWLVILNLSFDITQLNSEEICTVFIKDHSTYIPDSSEIIQTFTIFVRVKRAILNQTKEQNYILGMVNYKEN